MSTFGNPVNYDPSTFADADTDPGDDGYDFWWTPAGQFARWGIFGGIFFVFLLYMVLGYVHAKMRLKKNLPPLAYHRWLLSREQRGRFDPRYRDPDPVYYEYRPEQHGMHTFPPPVYDPSLVPPPTYQPPAGGTKTDPSQRLSEPVSRPGDLEQGTPEYEPPVGPPPAATLRQDRTGSSTTSNNPYKFWKRSAR